MHLYVNVDVKNNLKYDVYTFQFFGLDTCFFEIKK